MRIIRVKAMSVENNVNDVSVANKMRSLVSKPAICDLNTNSLSVTPKKTFANGLKIFFSCHRSYFNLYKNSVVSSLQEQIHCTLYFKYGIEECFNVFIPVTVTPFL